MKIVLASGSASRLSILRNAGVEPFVDPPNVDEQSIITSLNDAEPADVLTSLAVAKAAAIAGKHPDDVIIAADSMLLLDGELQGKPHTVEATIERWKNQRGKTAHLMTGHCIISPGGHAVYEHVASTTVTFGIPSDYDIERYAASGEPLPCAGAFTLEALGGWFIDRIEGDPSNVIGLSLPVVRAALYNFGLHVSQFWK